MNFRRPGEGSQDFELNLAPIIDCFTVIITYLLVSASFVSLAVLDAGIAAISPTTAAQGIVPLALEVELTKSGAVAFKLTGLPAGKEMPLAVAPLGGEFDFPGVRYRMEMIARDFPALKELTVSADPAVSYKSVVRAIEALKKIVPKVFLAS